MSDQAQGEIPLWSVVDEVHTAVDPSELEGEVLLYSVPAVEDTGGPELTDAAAIASAKQLLKGGEVLISKLNPRKSRVVIANAHVLPVLASPEFVALSPSRHILDRYLKYFLLSERTRQLLDSQVQSVTRSHQRVTSEIVRHTKLALPSLDQQRRIADFLDAEAGRFQRLTATQTSLRHVLLQRREAAVFASVTGSAETDRRPSTLAWTQDLPSSWTSTKLGYVARMGSGHTPSRSRPEWWKDCTIPWITTGEVSQFRDDRLESLTDTRERISEVGLSNSAAEVHPKGTVALCRTASAGYSVVMGSDMATSQDFVTWTCGPRLNPFYLLWCLRAMRRDLLGRLAMGSTHKTIYVPDLQMLRVPLPPVAEQQSIVRRIRAENAAIDAAVDTIDQQMQLQEARRRALITAAVTGQIDVTTARGISA